MREKVLKEFNAWLKEQPTEIINYEQAGAGYIRVSTDHQDELSPISQLKKIWEYAQAHKILLDEKNIFIEEEGISGRKVEKREAFQNMISIAKSENKSFDVIIVWKFSRFARNQEESIVYKSMLKRNNIDVVSISEPIIEGPFGTLIERIIEWMDEYYSINLSGEVVRGMTEKATRGEPQANAPFGYDYDKQNNKFVVNEFEANAVKFIFEKFANGELEMINIARYLNDHNFVTKRGNKFESRTVWYILTNPVYIGKLRWTPGRITRDDIYNNTNSIIADGTHQAIINEELFNAVNKRLIALRNTNARRSSGDDTPWHWMKKLIRCGSCGKTFIRASGKLTCNGYCKGTCKCKTRLEYISVERLILEQLKKDSQSKLKINTVEKHSSSNHNNSELKILKKQLDLISQKLERIKIAFENGIDTIEEYKENKSRIVEEEKKLKNKIAKLERKKDVKEKENIIRENMKTVYELLTDEKIDMKKKYEVAHFVINKIVYDEENNNLTMFYNDFEDSISNY